MSLFTEVRGDASRPAVLQTKLQGLVMLYSEDVYHMNAAILALCLNTHVIAKLPTSRDGGHQKCENNQYHVSSLLCIHIQYHVFSLYAVTTASIIRRKEESSAQSARAKADETAARARLTAEKAAWKARNTTEATARGAFGAAAKLAGKEREKAREAAIKATLKDRERAFKDADKALREAVARFITDPAQYTPYRRCRTCPPAPSPDPIPSPSPYPYPYPHAAPPDRSTYVPTLNTTDILRTNYLWDFEVRNALGSFGARSLTYPRHVPLRIHAQLNPRAGVLSMSSAIIYEDPCVRGWGMIRERDGTKSNERGGTHHMMRAIAAFE
ncbi:hypothetical protein B0H16DRAFT_1458121 [Mycena metata]|uniref:Uncharacterized protein n=1 Tax=Mycena metata TaxID=1033252 RepID=A0AAD7J482_9AGAR|nr:hypothetical protein B0H16DRAFT_1458121 [Mycena metata]